MSKTAPQIRFSPSLARKICDMISEGSSLAKIAELPGMPARRTVRGWLTQYPAFLHEYSIARSYWAQSLEERLVELAGQSQQVAADAARLGINENAAISAHRVEIDSIKWLMARAAPSLYSERAQVELTGRDGSSLIAPTPAETDPQKIALLIMAALNAAKPKAPPDFVATLPEIREQARLSAPVDLGPETVEAAPVRVMPPEPVRSEPHRVFDRQTGQLIQTVDQTQPVEQPTEAQRRERSRYLRVIHGAGDEY